MTNKIRCQSCGMPLGAGFYGSQKDGSLSHEFCKFCFQLGVYTRPNQTLNDMLELSIENMTRELEIPVEKAKELALCVIPSLKRWKNSD